MDRRWRWGWTVGISLALAAVVFYLTREAGFAVMLLACGLVALPVAPSGTWSRREKALLVLAVLGLAAVAYLLVQLRVCETQLRIAR